MADIENADNLVSFVIPHKGRFDMLRQTLLSISEQAYPLDEIEVLVISQTADIKTASLLEGSKINLQVMLRPESETISALRNHGVKHAKGQYLAFLDADIFISPNWIACMLNHLHSNDERVIVSAMQINGLLAPPLERIRTSLSNAELDADVAFLPGRNLFLTRHSFEDIGGFPEHLATCEDYYFTDKAAQLGSLYYTSDATYIHLGEDKTYSEMFKKEIWRGQSNLQSIQGRRIALRELPSFIMPIWICLAFLAAMVCFALHAAVVGWGFFLMGAGPLVVYCIRLYRLSKEVIAFASVFKFYATYFPARAIGTLVGLFKSIGANHD